ncbi:MAG: acyl-CoA dehydrogenase [Actinobacteria bacterium]|nr:MAG: acyl-CoA dehydrogenase [Actinomycetota bacterium]
MDYFDIYEKLTDEDLDIKRAAHTFAEEVVRPASRRLDAMSPEEGIAEDSPLWDFLKTAYELGYHTILLPEEYGGLGLSPHQINLIFEEIAWGGAGLGTLIAASCVPFFAACLTADDELIEEFVIPFCSCRDGSIRGCWAITEPDHGSDYFGCEDFFRNPDIRNNVQARLEGDEWVINGQKSAWVSGGTIATHALLFCQVDPSLGMAGGGICICPLDRDGVSRGKPLAKMGCRDLNQGEIYFDDVRIPKRYMFCEPDYYPEMLELILSSANAALGIGVVGIARAAFEEALQYARERVQGGAPIIEHRSVRQRLFQMFAKVEACRALSRSVIDLNLNISPPLPEYSLASKTFCTQLAFEVASEAMQILGGYGLTEEGFVEKLFRDARSAMIGDGNNEVLQAYGGKVLAEEYPRRMEDYF